MNLLESQPTWEFKTGNSFNCLHKCEPQIHGKEQTWVLEGQWYLYALLESPKYTHHQWSYVRAPLCWGAPSTTGPVRLPTEQIPRQRTLFFANSAVSYGLDSSSQGYVQTGFWDVALGLCELSPPRRGTAEALSEGPFNVDTNMRLPNEEMGWGCYLSPGSPSTGWKPMNPNGIG